MKTLYFILYCSDDIETFAVCYWGLQNQWLCRVKCILDRYIWDNQREINTNVCRNVIHGKIEDIALQQWYADISNSSMCVLYKLFKKKTKF